MIDELYDVFGIPCVARECEECGQTVMALWTPDGPEPAPASCEEHL